MKTIGQIVNGEIPRPKPNLNSIYNGTNAMGKIRPDKYKDFDKYVEDFRSEGMPLSKALQAALEKFIKFYHVYNEDAKF